MFPANDSAMGKQSKVKTTSKVENEATNVCMVCNRSFQSIYQMRIHQAEHTTLPTVSTTKKTGRPPKSASTSVKSLLNGKPSYTKKTTPRKTRKDDGKSISCDLCNKRYKRVAQLQLHMSRVHSDLKPFVCKVCALGFTDVKAYKLHVSTHSTDLPYKCDRCGECFQYSAYLESHRIIHTGNYAHFFSERIYTYMEFL